MGDYLESDFHDAEDVYGKTKSLGEIKDKNFYNIRTSIIGEENYNKKSLVEWFKSSAVNSELKGFKNHKWNGLTTKVFSELLYSIIKCKIDKNLIHLIPKNQNVCLNLSSPQNKEWSLYLMEECTSVQ